MQIISEYLNREINAWEIRFMTPCGPRVAVGPTLGRACDTAERENADPRRPALVVVVRE